MKSDDAESLFFITHFTNSSFRSAILTSHL